MTARLYRVILPVEDIESATAFYRTVLQVAGERVSPGRHYFPCGGVLLACYDPAADGDERGDFWTPHENQYLYFAVSDVAGARARVRSAGGREVGDIAAMPWGERLFYARDPFGNPICFVDEATVFTGSAPRLGVLA